MAMNILGLRRRSAHPIIPLSTSSDSICPSLCPENYDDGYRCMHSDDKNINNKADADADGYRDVTTESDGALLRESLHFLHYNAMMMRQASYGSSLSTSTCNLEEASSCGSDRSSTPKNLGGGGSLLHSVWHWASMLFHGVFHDFCTNGLPWQGYQCRSLLAGGSGCLYVLPALVCPSQTEQMLWLLQAILSVNADYFHIHHSSIAHGLDRLLAIPLTVITIWRGGSRLNPVTLLLAILPVGSNIAAGKAKRDLNFDRWRWWHFMWHLSGGLSCMLVIKLLYACPSGTLRPESFLSSLCRV